ncbi:hypothetical protein [Pseudomonas sp. O11]|uniref:gp53-like domain-containing protein n=1 Tax=Pseudomonas sp. O11 TaxID=3159446 RepID=UPI00387A9708
MYQIDNSTAAQAIPASTAAGNKGYFTDGNPATGTPATILPAEFMNMLMMENINVLAAAGIQPDKSKFNQLALAISTITGTNLTWANLGGKPTTSAGFGITDVYTKTQMDAFLLGKANSANTIAGYNISDAYTKQQTDAALLGKADKATTLAGYKIVDGMVIGTGGIGATTSPQATNVNTLPYGGLWSVNPGTVGAPFANGSVLHNAYDVASGNWTQIFADMGGSSMYWRGSLNYSISNLKKLWDSENFNPATKIDASAPVVTGSIAAVATSKLVSGVSPNTTDTPPTAANSVGMHMIFANQQFGADIVVAVNDVAGQLLFRGLGPTAGLGVWRSAWHDGNFTPSSKISGDNCSTAGFAYLGSNQDGDPYMKAANGAVVYLASKAYSVLGFQIVKGDTGYIKLPDFLGGFIMQWTKTPVLSTNTTYTWSFPLGFPSKCAGVIGTQIGISQGPLEVSVAPTQASVGLAIGIQTAAVGPAFAWAWGW